MHNNTVKSNDRKHSIYHIISDGMFKDGMYFSKSSYFDNVISLISSAQLKKKQFQVSQAVPCGGNEEICCFIIISLGEKDRFSYNCMLCQVAYAEKQHICSY